MSAHQDPIERFQPGDRESLERTITKEDVDAFAKLTGDFNGLHMDDEFAATTPYSERVVHGFLHGSLMSALVGMKLPGKGAVYLAQEIHFTAPVFIGDRIKVTGEVKRVDRSARLLFVNMSLTNQDGVEVLNGEAKVKVQLLSEWKKKENVPPKVVSTSKMLEGKSILVTGASRGIGRSIAETLADHGAFVWLNYHKSEAAVTQLAEEIKSRGGDCAVVKADVNQQKDVEQMFQTITSKGSLDVLINNAGPKIQSGRFEDLKWDDMSAAFNDVVGSVFRVTQEALPLLKLSKGKVINLITTAALGRTSYHWLPYVSAKNALIGLSKNLAQELGPSGVRVNMISPSLVNTDLVIDVPERYRKMMVSETPLRRLGTVEDVAGAALFLSSSFSDFITGDNMIINGGQWMS